MVESRIPAIPSLKALKAFEAAARHGNFVAAAAELCVTASAVSHQVRLLEETFGTALFRRTNRGIMLTPDGAALLPGLRGGFEQIATAVARIRDRQRSQRVTVSVFPTIAMHWLLPHLHEFYALHPGIEVRIATTDWHADFERDDIDCAFRFGDGDWPGLTAAFLYEERLTPVCSPALAEPDRPLSRPEHLGQCRLLHARVRPDDWPRWLEHAGLPQLVPAGHLTFETRYFATQAAIERLGVAIADPRLIAEDLRAGRLAIPFDLPMPTFGAYYFVHQPARAEEPALAAFRDWIMGRMRAETG